MLFKKYIIENYEGKNSDNDIDKNIFNTEMRENFDFFKLNKTNESNIFKKFVVPFIKNIFKRDIPNKMYTLWW